MELIIYLNKICKLLWAIGLRLLVILSDWVKIVKEIATNARMNLSYSCIRG